MVENYAELISDGTTTNNTNTNSEESNNRKRRLSHSNNTNPDDYNDSFSNDPILTMDYKRSKESILSPIKRSSKIPVTTQCWSDWDDTPEKKPMPANLIQQHLIGDHSNTEDSSSVDSFDLPLKTSSPAKRSAAKRLILPLPLLKVEEKENDSFDSFDASFEEREKTKPPRVFDSGIPNFPSLCDPSIVVSLLVDDVVWNDKEHYIICHHEGDLNNRSTVYLQDQWNDTKVDVGMKIKLIGAIQWGNSDWIVSNSAGVLIVCPDTLVPCTAIAGTSWCARKVLLNDRFKSGCEANKAMLIGCIIHEMMQKAVCHPDLSQINKDWMLAQWRDYMAEESMQALVSLKFTPAQFELELQPYAEVVVDWIHSHLPKNLTNSAKNLPTKTSIMEVHDIEDNIWDPLLGIKGKIDISLKTKSMDNLIRMEPLELKTGKSGVSVEHTTQVYLYCMMLSSRFDQKIGDGSLLYLKDGIERAVQPKGAELKGVLSRRNQLAYYWGKLNGERLPEPRSDPRFCDKCEQSLTCSLYQVAVENHDDLPITEAMKIFAKDRVAHLTPKHLDYFKRWMRWIYREWSTDMRKRSSVQSDLWNKTPDDREVIGECLSHMKIVSQEPIGSNGFFVTFSRNSSFRDGILTIGNMCTVSTNSKYGICLSFVIGYTETSVVLRCDARLNTEEEYHLDCYHSFSTYATTLGNLLMIMGPDELASDHRSLIIDLLPPRMNSHEECLSPSVIRIMNSSSLFPEQKQAVLSCITAKDYALIEGLPGAGKTTTIVVLVRCLVAMRKSVLITSYTNSAVDNLLVKLKEVMDEKSLLRLGSSNTIRDEVMPLTVAERVKKFQENKYAQTRDMMKTTPVVACTCHYAPKEMLFSWRKFDFCVVDEASMVLEPITLAALSASSRFILVGDTKQLTPLVQDKDAREEGMAISLFERLQVHKQAVSSLVSQFRMNRVLAAIPSALFYENRLVCANRLVAEATLSQEIPNYSVRKRYSDWLHRVVSDCIEDSCLFVDTNSVTSSEYQMAHDGGGVQFNQAEAARVADICRAFVESGASFSDIGVMCAYRKQVSNVQELLTDLAIEVNTVDTYQGRDKKIIVWSLVWTLSSGKKSELLAEARRVNVALTRARCKLVLIGCAASMNTIPIMQKVVEMVPIVKLQ